MLAAGRLREKITLRRLTDVSDGKGGYIRDWNTIAERLWAEVVGQAGRSAMLANTLQGIATYRIVIRYRPDIKANDQVLWNGLELNIVAPPVDPDGRREQLQIFADTSSPQNAAQ